jgi:streptomycin 6-kinase
MGIAIPARLALACRQTPHHTAWLAVLPDTIAELARRWSLTLGEPFDGDEVSSAWVAPATLSSGDSAVLKFGMPHLEAAHEIEGLLFWNGDAMVRVLEADVGLGAILLERCHPGSHLRSIRESDQDVVIAGLLRRLWRQPAEPHPFRSLGTLTAAWGDETERQEGQWPDRSLVEEGLELLRTLPATATRSALLTTDLHAGNVLSSTREPWLAIDPKPFVGDPAYDATQHLFNGEERLRLDPEGTIRRVAQLLDVDEERVRLWAFARAAAEPRNDWSRDWRLDFARAIAP